MALDTGKVRWQLRQLEKQFQELWQIQRELSRYQSMLNQAWKGREMTYFNHAISTLLTRCTELEAQMTELRKSIVQAASDILEEEAAAAAAMAVKET